MLGLKSAMLFVAFCLFWFSVSLVFFFLTPLTEQFPKFHFDFPIMILSMSLCILFFFLASLGMMLYLCNLESVNLASPLYNRIALKTSLTYV